LSLLEAKSLIYRLFTGYYPPRMASLQQ
jgi:hypothetical protein